MRFPFPNAKRYQIEEKQFINRVFFYPAINMHENQSLSMTKRKVNFTQLSYGATFVGDETIIVLLDVEDLHESVDLVAVQLFTKRSQAVGHLSQGDFPGRLLVENLGRK